jgi:Effector Associated Constant Component 1
VGAPIVVDLRNLLDPDMTHRTSFPAPALVCAPRGDGAQSGDGRMADPGKLAIVSSNTVGIRVDGSNDELRLLAQWLRYEDELRGSVELANRPPETGEMSGGLVDTVVVGLTSTSVITTVVKSLFTWLDRRNDASKIELDLKNKSGEQLKLQCGSTDDQKRIIESIRWFFDGDM